MCNSEFSKILIVGHEDKKMLLCKRSDFEKLNQAKRQLLLKTAFPELKPKGFFSELMWKVKYRIVHCYKLYSSQFDCRVGVLEKDNNWDEFSFFALRILKLKGKTYCNADLVEPNKNPS